MMPARSMVRMIVANTLRSPKHFVLSAFGIVMGIAAFVFFLGLSTGVRAVILGKIFPLEQVQVVAPRASLLLGEKRLDDAIVDTIRKRPEVAEALPRMNLNFPAYGKGRFEGQDLRFEVGGFADGIDAGFVGDSPRTAELFRDWEIVEKDQPKVACEPAPPDPDEDDYYIPPAPAAPAAPAAGTPAGPTSGTTASPAAGSVGEPAAAPRPRGYKNTCPKPDLYYCDESTRVCTRRVPVVVSPTLLELYNGQFAKSHGLPTINSDLAEFIVKRGGLGRMRFTIGLGSTIVTGSNAKIDRSQRRRIEAQLIGISPKAMPIGMTMPIDYIRRWNREYLGEEAAGTYSSIIVTLKNKDELAVFSQWLQDDLGLRLEDSLGERFATAIFLVTSLFVLISFVIITISAINIAHNFFMQVSERRRELGILRAVGATRRDVRLIILGEAAFIGVIGGLIGVGLAVSCGALVDWASSSYLPRFPFKPTTYFAFESWIWLSGLGFSTFFCILGGFLPARRAALLEPAAALAQT
ncbi:MAG: ABC transporter permease [Myxococcales bacterium]|nr:ABC transporter permease [Myxococcales bacterium]